jgi:hypothetical protein
MKASLCPRCLTLQEVVPKSYGITTKFDLHLCNKCHSELEAMLPARKLCIQENLAIARKWLRGENPYVY